MKGVRHIKNIIGLNTIVEYTSKNVHIGPKVTQKFGKVLKMGMYFQVPLETRRQSKKW